jgi:hypothetical protein
LELLCRRLNMQHIEDLHAIRFNENYERQIARLPPEGMQDGMARRSRQRVAVDCGSERTRLRDSHGGNCLRSEEIQEFAHRHNRVLWLHIHAKHLPQRR